MENSDDQRIVFFDGVCHLCNGFVDFVILRDQRRTLLFAPLQGETAQKLLQAKAHQNARDSLMSVLFWDKGQVFSESDAVLKILTHLPRYKFLGYLGFAIPAFLRNILYRLIARYRYKLFGKRDFCRIPTPEERAYLLP